MSIPVHSGKGTHPNNCKKKNWEFHTNHFIQLFFISSALLEREYLFFSSSSSSLVQATRHVIPFDDVFFVTSSEEPARWTTVALSQLVKSK